MKENWAVIQTLQRYHANYCYTPQVLKCLTSKLKKGVLHYTELKSNFDHHCHNLASDKQPLILE